MKQFDFSPDLHAAAGAKGIIGQSGTVGQPVQLLPCDFRPVLVAAFVENPDGVLQDVNMRALVIPVGSGTYVL
jgi:hypothetical protein